MSRPRLKRCTEQWPECTEGEYNPSCCRFPKSCYCTIYNDDTPPDELEDATADDLRIEALNEDPDIPDTYREGVRDGLMRGVDIARGEDQTDE